MTASLGLRRRRRGAPVNATHAHSFPRRHRQRLKLSLIARRAQVAPSATLLSAVNAWYGATLSDEAARLQAPQERGRPRLGRRLELGPLPAGRQSEQLATARSDRWQTTSDQWPSDSLGNAVETRNRGLVEARTASYVACHPGFRGRTTRGGERSASLIPLEINVERAEDRLDWNRKCHRVPRPRRILHPDDESHDVVVCVNDYGTGVARQCERRMIR